MSQPDQQRERGVQTEACASAPDEIAQRMMGPLSLSFHFFSAQQQCGKEQEFYPFVDFGRNLTRGQQGKKMQTPANTCTPRQRDAHARAINTHTHTHTPCLGALAEGLHAVASL